MRKWFPEILAGIAVCLGVLTLVHQHLTNNDPWFDWRDFWHHEPLAACAFVAAVALMVGKYMGRNER